VRIAAQALLHRLDESVDGAEVFGVLALDAAPEIACTAPRSVLMQTGAEARSMAGALCDRARSRRLHEQAVVIHHEPEQHQHRDEQKIHRHTGGCCEGARGSPARPNSVVGGPAG
jgi:hypothetical protein